MLAFLMFMFSVSTNAAANELALRAERDAYGFQAQQTATFGEKKFQFSRNSNFLCRPETEVFLGSFSAEYGIFEKAQAVKARYLAVASERSLAGRSLKSTTQSHDLKIFIDDHPVVSATVAPKVERLLTGLCNTSHWKPEKAASAKLDVIRGRSVLKITQYVDGKPKAFRLVPLEEANCQARDTALVCDVEGYGQAYLQL